jgi:hypothetical protein
VCCGTLEGSDSLTELCHPLLTQQDDSALVPKNISLPDFHRLHHFQSGFDGVAGFDEGIPHLPLSF